MIKGSLKVSVCLSVCLSVWITVRVVRCFQPGSKVEAKHSDGTYHSATIIRVTDASVYTVGECVRLSVCCMCVCVYICVYIHVCTVQCKKSTKYSRYIHDISQRAQVRELLTNSSFCVIPRLLLIKFIILCEPLALCKDSFFISVSRSALRV